MTRIIMVLPKAGKLGYICVMDMRIDKYPRTLHQGFMDIDECLEFMRNHTISSEDEWNVFD